jgi:hypothetical protein
LLFERGTGTKMTYGDVEYQRCLVRDLTTALEHRNRELKELREKVEGSVLIDRTTAAIVCNVFIPANPNKLRKAHPDVVKAAHAYRDACRIAFGPSTGKEPQA